MTIARRLVSTKLCGGGLSFTSQELLLSATAMLFAILALCSKDVEVAQQTQAAYPSFLHERKPAERCRQINRVVR